MRLREFAGPVLALSLASAGCAGVTQPIDRYPTATPPTSSSTIKMGNLLTEASKKTHIIPQNELNPFLIEINGVREIDEGIIFPEMPRSYGITNDYLGVIVRENPQRAPLSIPTIYIVQVLEAENGRLYGYSMIKDSMGVGYPDNLFSYQKKALRTRNSTLSELYVGVGDSNDPTASETILHWITPDSTTSLTIYTKNPQDAFEALRPFDLTFLEDQDVSLH